MLPPPTTIATSTPRLCTRSISLAIACTRSGSVPYSRSPIRASPESLSSTRPYAGAFTAVACATSVTHLEAREASHDDVLAGLGRERCAQLFDRLGAVLLLVEVLVAQQDDVVE